MHFSASFNKKKMEVLICSAPVISAVECLNSDIYAGGSRDPLAMQGWREKDRAINSINGPDCSLFWPKTAQVETGKIYLTPKGQQYLE